TNGTAYYYRITATDIAGNESDPSDEATATPIGPQTITFGPLADATYGDAPITLEATASSGLEVTYASSDPAIASVSDNILTIHAAGTVTITASQAGNAAFLPAADVEQPLTVVPLGVTVTADDQGKVFGEADPELTYTAAPALVGSDAFTGGLARDAGEDPGDYAITQGTLAASSNYTVTFVGGTFTITPATITGITLDDGSFAYDGTAHALAIVGTLPDGVTVNYTGNDQANVGEFLVTATLSGMGYEILTLTATLTIGKVHITGITFDDGTFT